MTNTKNVPAPRCASTTALVCSLVLNVAVAVMEAIAFSMSWAGRGTGLFVYYTQDSNILAGIACAICAVVTARVLLSGRDGSVVIPQWVHFFKYVAACVLSVTFIVVVTVLAPTSGPNGYQMMLFHGEMLFTHFICPILTVISFVVFEHEPKLEKRSALLAVIPTLIYGGVTIVANIMKVLEGPYPFLRVYNQPVWASVLWAAIIFCGAYLFARAILALNTLAAKNDR